MRLLAALLALLFASCALAEKRAALVIGNASYAAMGSLANPLNDARDVAKALAGLDFRVEIGENLDQRAFEAKIENFVRIAGDADVVLLYYAGHGLGLSGESYLLPVDADFATAFQEIGRAHV